MGYTVLVGEYAYSSWSMRGWMMADAFGIPFRTKYVPMYSEDFTNFQTEYAPARTVATLLIDEDSGPQAVWDSLAIAETLHEAHPDAGVWPSDPIIRRAARSLAAEMHSSFRALRDRPSMNLRARYEGFRPTEAELADVARVEELWEWALAASGGPYLCGEFSAVDAMFAPVATRLVTYGFEVGEAARGYVEAIYAHPSFRRWHACADAQQRVIERYHLDLPDGEITAAPRIAALPAKHYEGDIADAINTTCPYSGDPIAEDSLAEIEGKVVGFCNPFCCRKSIADAEAWPKLMAILRA